MPAMARSAPLGDVTNRHDVCDVMNLSSSSFTDASASTVDSANCALR